jgi:energy-coupling factor transporter ATP-binding protein EcfA2
MRLLVIGPSGCGKSTFFKTLAGLTPPVTPSGLQSVCYVDDLINTEPPHGLYHRDTMPIQFHCRKSDIMFVPQRGYCFQVSQQIRDDVRRPGSLDYGHGCVLTRAPCWRMSSIHHRIARAKGPARWTWSGIVVPSPRVDCRIWHRDWRAPVGLALGQGSHEQAREKP